MKINCDLGEGFAHWQKAPDADIMPFIDQANIACGFHAGDPLIMTQTIKQALKHGVQIGAHPGYQDLRGFGRRSLAFTDDELTADVLYQLGALDALCRAQGTRIQYVKPHGALYQDMMREDSRFLLVLRILTQFSSSLPLVVQATPEYKKYQSMADDYEVELWFEAFSDRHYQSDGRLVPRSQPNAVIYDVDLIRARVSELKQKGELLSVDGQTLSFPIDTLCLHGDTPNALEIARTLADVVHG